MLYSKAQPLFRRNKWNKRFLGTRAWNEAEAEEQLATNGNKSMNKREGNTRLAPYFNFSRSFPQCFWNNSKPLVVVYAVVPRFAASHLLPIVANCCYATMELLFRRNKRLRNKGEQRRNTWRLLIILKNCLLFPKNETLKPFLLRWTEKPKSPLRYVLRYGLRFRLLFLPSASFHALIPKE